MRTNRSTKEIKGADRSVHDAPALRDVAGVLFGVGRGPSTELGEVREGGLVVIVSVPRVSGYE